MDAKEPGRFTERQVCLGQNVGDHVEALSGVSPGKLVVTDGSFFARAELERLGLPSRRRYRPPSAHPLNLAVTGGSRRNREGHRQRGRLRAGHPDPPGRCTCAVTFVRTTDKTCGTEVVFPSLGIKRALPLNEAVIIEITPEKGGPIEFACGMNMLRRSVVVE